jgi:hypothetical protein
MKEMENAKLAFYSNLANFLANKVTQLDLLARLEQAYNQCREVLSIGEISFYEDIWTWHYEYLDPNLNGDSGIERMEWLTECLFKDLASQMRNEPVRQLLKRYKEMAGISQDLFIHARKIRNVDGTMAIATVIIDDLAAFRKFFEDPDHFVRMVGHTHYSEVGEVNDSE